MNIDVTNDVHLVITEDDREPEVKIENRTGRTIVRYYRRLAGSTEWGTSRLSKPLANNYSIQSKFDYPSNDVYDYRFEDDMNNVYTKQNVSVSRSVTLSITATDKQ
jgi:hypothetical protein